MISRFVFLLGLLSSILIGPILLAETILQPIGVTVHAPLTENLPSANLINQSGLSAGYSSLLDDFDAYIATEPTHADRNTGKWQTETGFVLPGNIDFDLGASYRISALALWNTNDRNAVDEFTLLVDDNAEFSDPHVLGHFSADQVLTPQVFNFATQEAAYLRMSITAANGDRIRIGEVALSVAERELLLGDINNDGEVGFRDFLILSANFSESVEVGTNGDLNDDGIVDFPDFLVLSVNFGRVSAIAVPEPSGLLLVLFGLLFAASAAAKENVYCVKLRTLRSVKQQAAAGQGVFESNSLGRGLILTLLLRMKKSERPA